MKCSNHKTWMMALAVIMLYFNLPTEGMENLENTKEKIEEQNFINKEEVVDMNEVDRVSKQQKEQEEEDARLFAEQQKAKKEEETRLLSELDSHIEKIEEQINNDDFHEVTNEIPEKKINEKIDDEEFHEVTNEEKIKFTNLETELTEISEIQKPTYVLQSQLSESLLEVTPRQRAHEILSPEITDKSLNKSKSSTRYPDIGRHIYAEDPFYPKELQLKKNEYVLIELEDQSVYNFIKTLLVFAKISPFDFEANKKYDPDRKFWDTPYLQEEIASFLRKEISQLRQLKLNDDESSMEFAITLEKLEKLTKSDLGSRHWDRMWTPEGMDYLIKLIPRIFGCTVEVYDLDRKHHKTYSVPQEFTAREEKIRIIQNGAHELHPVRRLEDLKKEFPNLKALFGDEKITFSPLNMDRMTSDDEELTTQDVEELKIAIYSYNPDNDYREKDKIKRQDLEKIKSSMMIYLSEGAEFVDHKGIGFKSYISKELKESINNEVKEFINEEGKKNCPPSLVDFKSEDYYALKKCFDIYIPNKKEDWKNFDNNMFELVLENCRRYKVDGKGSYYGERFEVVQISEFYFWSIHDVKLSHRAIVEKLNGNKKLVMYWALGSLIIEVIPCCSAWKDEYLNRHPKVALYEIKLENAPLMLFSFWSLYSFGYFQYDIPFYQHRIHKIDQLSQSYFKEEVSDPCRKQKAWNYFKNNEYLACRTTMGYAHKAFVKLEEVLEGKSKNLVFMLVTLFFFNEIANVAINFGRDTWPGLDEILPPPMPWYMFIHKALTMAKTFVFVFFGSTKGFGDHAGEGYYMYNISHWDNASKFLDTVQNFFMTKAPITLTMMPMVITAKLIKVTAISLGFTVGSNRRLKFVSDSFVYLFHCKYDNRVGYWEWMWKNKIPLVSKFLLTMAIFGTKHGLTGWLEEDFGDFMGIFGLLFLWDWIKPLRNLSYASCKALSDGETSICESFRRREWRNVGSDIIKGIVQKNAEIGWTIFGLILLSFYSLFNLEHTAVAFQFIFEAGLNFAGVWIWIMLFNMMVVLMNFCLTTVFSNSNILVLTPTKKSN